MAVNRYKSLDPLIELRCPDCGETMRTARLDDDPPEATVCEIICPDCDDGDFHAARFIDRYGNEVR
ncbi:hypothetical protein [Novosphingobium naphthalenivorans]|uniref:hypothetical protein n=1 Tax=Novosphingobium naphthalenivorans TaxID=273168 RepID=UPI000830F094|nr:hypothetical protein [Novosphingobium naphthalenivorans]